MTTHEQQARVPDDYGETQNPTATAPVAEQPAATNPPVAGDEHTETPAEPSAPAPARHESATEETLFAEDDLTELRGRWAAVQAAFVDDPKDCVQKADVLVSDLVDQLTSGFAQARSRLEEQWARGQEASTEDLRVALMHYREFFERLLAV